MAALLILPSEVIEIIWGFWLLRVCACWLCVDGCLPCLCCDRACCTLAHCQSLHTALRHFFSRLQTVPCLLVACYHESMLLADWLSNGDIPEEWEVVMFPLYCFVVNKKFCIPALSCYFQSSPERELHQSCHYMSNTQNVFSLDFFLSLSVPVVAVPQVVALQSWDQNGFLWQSSSREGSYIQPVCERGSYRHWASASVWKPADLSKPKSCDNHLTVVPMAWESLYFLNANVVSLSSLLQSLAFLVVSVLLSTSWFKLEMGWETPGRTAPL